MGEYKVITEAEGESYGFGVYPVTIVPHIYVPVSDGIKLSVKFWFPLDGVKDKYFENVSKHLIYKGKNAVSSPTPYPIIMEYIPYRKSDGTLTRDHDKMTWYATHGYICARVDMRGSGESEGVYTDEYLPQEQKDACDIIEWFAKQPWCNGNVGMYGKSWSGFNGLQVAFEQPKALKTVISLYSTDDRYASDAHYIGGCVLANQALWWSSYMFTLNAAPPHPAIVPNWRTVWMNRLKDNEPWVHKWLSEQRRTDYWKHGSICEDPSRIQCPVLMMGGWNDGYHDAVFRAVETLPNVRGVIGPWSHNWPDVAAPGPAIGFKEVCLSWWDCHLKGIENGTMEAPKLRAFIQESFKPEPDVRVDRTGKWVNEPKWPPVESDRWIKFIPSNKSMSLTHEHDLPMSSIDECKESIQFDQSAPHGIASGEWWFISTNSLPSDQRIERPFSLHWKSEALKENISILGFPVLETSITIKNSDTGIIAVRLSDVFPDGKTNLITYGLLNLTHRNGHGKDDVKPLVPEEIYKVSIKCMSAGYTILKGHSLELSVAPNYWPLCWPSKNDVEMEILTGNHEVKGRSEFHTQLMLPTVTQKGLKDDTNPFPPVRIERPVLPAEEIRPPSYRRHMEMDISTKKRVLVVTEDSGMMLLKQTGVVMGSSFEARYGMDGEDPLSANIDISYKKEYEYPEVEGGIKVMINTQSRMSADAVNFHLQHELKIDLNGEEFYSNTWDKDIKRDLV